jgi:hypothetical protein
MKRILFSLFLGVFVFRSTVDAQQHRTRAKTSTAKRSASVGGIRDCPDEGRGGDPNLNRRKNIRSDNKRTTLQKVQWMKDRPDPKNFTRQTTSRAELARLGEGRKITVVAYALVARPGSKESCNCGLSAVKDTDNHIVLVDPTTKKPTLAANEPDSETAEFTPRVRLDHRNFSRAKLQPLIDVRGRQLVRVTGLLMFDSEHFLGRHLKRHNNWEIHPVLKMEYCAAATCSDTGDAGWKSLDNR